MNDEAKEDPEDPEPLRVEVDYELLMNAHDALQTGLEYAKEVLLEHDASLGRSIRKNRMLAEQIETDIDGMEKVLKALKGKFIVLR